MNTFLPDLRKIRGHYENRKNRNFSKTMQRFFILLRKFSLLTCRYFHDLRSGLLRNLKGHINDRDHDRRVKDWLLKISFLETIYNSTVMKKMKMHLVARKVQIWCSNFHIVQINFFSSWLCYHFRKMNIRIISMLNLENIIIMLLN